MTQGYTKNGGPACPKVERLEELMDEVSGWKLDPQNAPQDAETDKHNNLVQEVVEALDWTHTMLSNRKVYQKKNQIRKKVTLEVAISMLGPGELDEIKAEASRRLQREVVDGKF